MPNRLDRLTSVLFKQESTIGVDSVPTGVANAMYVGDCTVRPLVATNVSRDRIRNYIGGNEQLVGTKYKEVSFNVELVGSGTAGTAPAWGPLLRACAMAETIVAATRVDYTPVSAGQETASIYVFKDGVRHVLLAAKGEWSLAMTVGGIPMLSFRFMGLDGSETAVANPTLTLTAWMQPQVVTDAFTTDMVIGGTVSPTGAPAITGGTAVISGGLELSSGHNMPFNPLIGAEFIDITARDVTGRVMLDETAANEVLRMADVRANTVRAISLLHGTVTGRKALVHLAQAQLIDPAYEDREGKLMQGYSVRAVPTAAGNDEVRITTSF